MLNIKKLILPLTLLAILLPLTGEAQERRNGEIRDRETLEEIMREGEEHSQIEEYAYLFSDYMGPRLMASDQFLRAQESSIALFEELGLESITIDSVGESDFTGWDYSRCYAAMNYPYYDNFACVPAPWCKGTDSLVSGEVIYLDIENIEDFEEYRGRLKGKIVLLPIAGRYSDPHFTGINFRFTEEDMEYFATYPTDGSLTPPREGDDWDGESNAFNIREIRRLVESEEPLAIIYENGIFNTIRSQSPWFYLRNVEPAVELAVTAEALGKMERLAKHGVAVRMEIELKTSENHNRAITNISAEIPGCNKKLRDEVILVGAHLDSWHGGTGALDNGSGCATIMEAARILKALKIKPERTIRFILWGGEELGFYGSENFCEKHLDDNPEACEKIALYLNVDNGSGLFRGICLEETPEALPFFERWSRGLEQLGFTTLSLHRSPGTDHVTLDARGIPAYQFIQDEVGYYFSMHTTMDTFERLQLDDMRSNATMLAWLILSAANDPARIPHH